MADIQLQGAIPPYLLNHRLRIAREYADIHQADLADDIGISRRTLGKYENGEVEPKRHVLIAWALRCGVSLDWLVTGMVPPGSGDPATLPDGPEDGPSARSSTDRASDYGSVVRRTRRASAEHMPAAPARKLGALTGLRPTA